MYVPIVHVYTNMQSCVFVYVCERDHTESTRSNFYFIFQEDSTSPRMVLLTLQLILILQQGIFFLLCFNLGTRAKPVIERQH